MAKKTLKEIWMDNLSERTGVEVKTTTTVIEGVKDLFVENSKKHEPTWIPGIGTFSAKHNEATKRSGINLQTKEKVVYDIPEKTTVSFKVEKATFNEINPHLKKK